jgi:peptidase E
MAPEKGLIVLMGSGELTATMVEVHKDLTARYGESPRAVFLDTPAGFQLNVDLISKRAKEYFRTHVRQALEVASLKSVPEAAPIQIEQAYHTLRKADYILIGPGSPTYAIRQLKQTQVPDILIRRIENGGCLAAASAAALTVGRFSLPVYEIYKVGAELHWVEGMNILGRFGFDLVVVPHWNNAEGGNHDTRCCFMGKSRFEALLSLLPEGLAVFGLDEHTACVMDLEKGEAEVRGIGRTVLIRGDREWIFQKGERFDLGLLRGSDSPAGRVSQPAESAHPEPEIPPATVPFWDRVHDLEKTFHSGLKRHDSKDAASALLELDRILWQARQDLESEETISEAREVLRESIVLVGAELDASPADRVECIESLVEELLALREFFRERKMWETADAIRDSLQRAGILIEDTERGARWRLQNG